MNIKPDKMITVDKKLDTSTLSIIENGEIVKQLQLPATTSRTLYSMYYEFMKLNNYYGDNVQQSNSLGMHM